MIRTESTTFEETLRATMHRLGMRNEHVYVGCDSVGAIPTRSFARDFEKRFVSVGNAVSQLIGTMSGISLLGKTVFIFVDARLLTGRALEIFRAAVAHPHANVKCIGLNHGYGGNALAMMTTMPHVKVVSPVDESQCEKALEALVDDFGPAYMHVPSMIDVGWTEDATPFTLGKAVTHFAGGDVGIIAAGEMVHVAADTLHLLQEKSLYGRILNLSTIVPCDTDAIIETARSCKLLVVIDDQIDGSGISRKVQEVLCAEYPRDVCTITISRENPFDPIDSRDIAERVMQRWRQAGYY